MLFIQFESNTTFMSAVKILIIVKLILRLFKLNKKGKMYINEQMAIICYFHLILHLFFNLFSLVYTIYYAILIYVYQVHYVYCFAILFFN